MMFFRWTIIFLFIIGLASSCSTEKNTLINRKYHSVTAKYNGYFNANELINLSIRSYKASYKEDFYVQLPIERLPSEKEVEGILPAIDTAISKCTKVIQNHSMPSIKGAYKKVEYNTYIDENFVTVGQANFYKRNFESAARNFEFVSRLFAADKSNFIAKLWQARIDIELGNFSEALIALESLDDVVEEQYGEDAKENKQKAKSKSKSSKKKSKSKKVKEKVPAKFPKYLRDDLERVKAEYYNKKKETKLAIAALEKAVLLAPKKEKARLHFILGQLHALNKAPSKSNESYSKCLQYPAPYVMHFNAKMNKALSGKDKGIKTQLVRMLKEAKNTEYRDQIYYALAAIELQESHKKQASVYLTQSAQATTTNKRQKAMSYEKLGDLSFDKSDYVAAQKYFDSCATVMPENYPNGEEIKNKASKLKSLVQAVETATFEDSVQRIALLSEPDRIEYLEDVLEQIKKDNARKKRIEAQKMQEMQEALNKQNEASGKKGYWNNNKTLQEGLAEFKKNWGDRENKDDWRRSEKLPANFGANENDSIASNDVKKEEEDSLTIESLAANLPLTEEAMKKSIDKLLNAWFDAAVIYKDQLNEEEIAITYFKKILDKKYVNEIDLSAAFQLYRINDGKSMAETYKAHILKNYPTSDYASYLKDPEFFLKLKNQAVQEEKKYLDIFEKYQKKQFSTVISAIDDFLKTAVKTDLNAKFKLLRVNALANVTLDKKTLIPDLTEITKEFPGSDEEKRANEMIRIIQTGFSKNDSLPIKKESPYIYSDDAIHYAIVVTEKAINVTDVQNKVNTLNAEKFVNLKLKSSTLVFNDGKSFVLLKEFKSLKKGKEYISTFKSSKRELGKFNELKIVLISAENLKKLLELKNIEEYELFHDENY